MFFVCYFMLCLPSGQAVLYAVNVDQLAFVLPHFHVYRYFYLCTVQVPILCIMPTCIGVAAAR